AGRGLRVDGVEIDGAVSAEREVSNVQLRAQVNRAGRMCGLARLPDQQPVIEDVEQPDRAVPRHVERDRSGRPIGAAAAVSVLLEADLAGSGLRDDFGRAQVAELMRA